MKLRKLEGKDAPLMLEWMHDEELCRYMKANFNSMVLSDCQRFIESAQDTGANWHMAIVDDADEYMGTVSLKSINYVNKNAEFGIVIRRKAMGTGCASWAMRTIINMAFAKNIIEEVYWCVSEKNLRACKFYDKNGYIMIANPPSSILEKYKDCDDLRWYLIKKEYSI